MMCSNSGVMFDEMNFDDEYTNWTVSYVKMFNRFLKTVVEKRFERKYHQDIKLMLYGIKIKPNSKAYKSIPVEELLAPQAAVIFFIEE